MPRTVHAVGRIVPTPFLGGLHHLYVRVGFPTGIGLGALDAARTELREITSKATIPRLVSVGRGPLGRALEARIRVFILKQRNHSGRRP
jgi:hypothetical protein